MDNFLAAVEKQAFVIARSACRDEQVALDIVQDAMFSMVKNYTGKKPETWTPLFFKILNNRITDQHRKRGLGRLTQWFGTSHDNDDNIIEITMTDYIDTTIPAAAAAQTSIQSILLLNFVAVIWGTQHSFIKMSVEDCDASAFTFSRFALAAIIATIGPLLFRGDDEDVLNNSNSSDSIADLDEEKNTQSSAMIENKEENRIAWRWGIEMGIWMLLGYAFQAIGLEVCRIFFYDETYPSVLFCSHGDIKTHYQTVYHSTKIRFSIIFEY